MSPYPRPTTPHSPNGIAHYVVKGQRPTVKNDWKIWVELYKTAYINNQPYPAAFNVAGLYTN